jgi:hypothetical protein
MNKLFQLTITSLLASGVALSAPVLANPTTAESLEASPSSLASDSAAENSDSSDSAAEKAPLLDENTADSAAENSDSSDSAAEKALLLDENTADSAADSSDSVAEKAPLLEKEAANSKENSKPDISSTCYDGLCFTLQHRFNEGEALPAETIAILGEKLEENPLVLLQEIRKNFSKHLKTQTRPVKIHTELAFLLPTDVIQVLGEIPNVSINTNIQKEGSGTSHVEFRPYRREIPEQFGEGFLDWKGFVGDFTFTDQFKTLTAALNMPGFNVQGKDGFTAVLEPTTLNATLGANWMPTKLDLVLPSFKSQEGQGKNGRFDIQGLVVNFETKKTSSGIEAGHLNLNLGKVDFVNDDANGYLENVAVTAGGEEQEDLFSYTLQTQIGKLRLPPELALGESLDVNYAGNIQLGRLDVEALLALQTMFRQIQVQLDSSMAMPLLMQTLAIVPQLLAKSPEIALNQWHINTPKGNLQGNVTVKLDGTKVTDLFNPQKWLAALQAQVALAMDKTFAEHAITSQVYYIMLQYMGGHGFLNEADLKQLQQQAKIMGLEQLQKFVGMKWLVETEQDSYKLEADFKDQKLILNGQEMELPMSFE